MLRGSVWYLEQWDRIHSPLYKPVWDAASDTSRSKGSRLAGWSAAVAYTLYTAGAPAIIIGSSPYYSAYKYSSELSLGWRTATRAEGGLLAHRTGVSTWINKGAFRSGFRSRAFRLGLVKAGSRLIPGLGWGLLAYDIYSVSKWYLETDF